MGCCRHCHAKFWRLYLEQREYSSFDKLMIILEWGYELEFITKNRAHFWKYVYGMYLSQFFGYLVLEIIIPMNVINI